MQAQAPTSARRPPRPQKNEQKLRGRDQSHGGSGKGMYRSKSDATEGKRKPSCLVGGASAQYFGGRIPMRNEEWIRFIRNSEPQVGAC